MGKRYIYRSLVYILLVFLISALIGYLIFLLPTIEFLYSPIRAYLAPYPDLSEFLELMLSKDTLGYSALAFFSISCGFLLTMLITGIFYGVKSCWGLKEPKK